MVGITRRKVILHSRLYTPHSTLHTLDTLHALHFTLHTSHSTFYTLHSTLYTLYTPHSAFDTPHLALYMFHSALCTPHLTLQTPHFTHYTLRDSAFFCHVIYIWVRWFLVFLGWVVRARVPEHVLVHFTQHRFLGIAMPLQNMKQFVKHAMFLLETFVAECKAC